MTRPSGSQEDHRVAQKFGFGVRKCVLKSPHRSKSKIQRSVKANRPRVLGRRSKQHHALLTKVSKKEINFRVPRFDSSNVEPYSKRELWEIIFLIEPGVGVLAKPSYRRTIFNFSIRNRFLVRCTSSPALLVKVLFKICNVSF